MKPLHYELTSFCQYASARFDYEPGVSVFWAENGYGKTNLWDVGQFFAWTGTIPGGASKKDVVKWGEKKGGASFTFEHRGIEYSLSWAVPGSSCSMTWVEDGESHNLVKAGDIQSKLETDIFNMPLRMLREVCFVPQGSFADTIVDKTARTEYFSRITDTKRFSTIRDRVVKLKGQIPVHADVDIEIDNQLTSISDLEGRVNDLEGRESEARKEFERVKPQREEASRILKTPVDDDIRLKVDELESELEQMKGSAPEKLEEPQPPDVPEDLCNEVIQLQAPAVEIERLEAEKESLEIPEDPRIEEPRQDLELEATLHPIAVRSAEKGECLVCRHSISEDPDTFASESRSAEARQSLEALNAYAESKRAYARDVERIDGELSRQKECLNRKWETISERDDVDTCEVREEGTVYLPWVYLSTGVEINPSDWELITTKWQEYKVERDKYLKNCAQVSKHETREANIRARLADLQKEGTVSSDQQTAARTVLQWVEAKEKECSDAKNELMSAEAELKASRKSLETLRVQQSKRNNTEKLRNTLESAADVLKPSRLPMRVMRPFLAPYNRRLSQYMEKSMVDYVCRMTPKFEYEFNSGEGWKPAERMSGGQLGNLAMCAQLAKMDVVAQGCPLLVLDEPTYGLDEQRKKGMVQSLRDLNAREKGLYIMVVSHDPLMKEAADRLITPDSFRTS